MGTPVTAFPHSGRVCHIHAASVMSLIAKITLYVSLVYLDRFVQIPQGTLSGQGFDGYLRLKEGEKKVFSSS